MSKIADDIKREILRKIHKDVGLCATCGVFKCKKHKAGTKLPTVVSRDVIVRAFNMSPILEEKINAVRSDKIESGTGGIIEQVNEFTTIHRSR